MDMNTFRIWIGFIVLFAALLYSVLVTLALILFGSKVCENQLLWAFLTNIVSTVLGWVIGKASTVIDYTYGDSAKRDQNNVSDKPVDEVQTQSNSIPDKK